MSSEVNIILKAVDQASGVIKGVTSTTGKMNSAFQSLTGISLGAAGGMVLVGKAISEVVDFTKASITETVAYNKQIREMTQVLGLSADETSRVVQVADDWGISIEAVRTSLGMMNKNGVQPSIENLAKLADEYVSTNDKTAFAEKASKLLGRSYQTLIPILAKGGDALREQADAIDDSLIATDEAIDASREYEVAADDLSDAWQGFKHTIGNAVIPVLADVLEATNANIDRNKEAAEVYYQLKTALDNGSISANEYREANEALRKQTDDYIPILEKAIVAEENRTGSWDDSREESIKLSGAITGLSSDTEDLTQDTEELQKAAEDAAKALQDELKVSLDNLQSLIDGKLGPEMEDFTQGQAELEQKMIDVRAEINRLLDEGYKPMSEEVLGLEGDYGELKDQYDENATAHDEATQRILFDILTQQAAVDGLTTAEVGFLTQIATKWGLIDQETADATLRAQEAMDYVNRSGDFEGAEKIINGQATAWSLAKEEAALAKGEVMGYGNLLDGLDGKTVETSIVNTKYERMVTLPIGWKQGDPYPAFASGADFIVPPGYPNDSYRMNVESGEHVVVIPKDVVNRTMNVYPTFVNASGEGVMNDLMFYAKQYGMA